MCFYNMIRGNIPFISKTTFIRRKLKSHNHRNNRVLIEIDERKILGPTKRIKYTAYTVAFSGIIASNRQSRSRQIPCLSSVIILLCTSPATLFFIKGSIPSHLGNGITNNIG